jgi:hypothetical protein
MVTVPAHNFVAPVRGGGGGAPVHPECLRGRIVQLAI